MSLPVISPKSHRIAVVHKDDCFSKKCHLECIKFCPVNLEGSDCIVLGDDGKATINESLCNGCGICMSVCPNEVAITDNITIAKSNIKNKNRKISLLQKILNRP